MALDLYLDPLTNDLALDEHGELRLVGDDPLIEALGQSSSFGELVAQRLRYRLRTQKGEWFLDLEEGVDWLAMMQSRPVDLGAVRAELVALIASTEGVSSIREFELDTSGRELRVSFEVVAGDTVIRAEGLLPDPDISVT